MPFSFSLLLFRYLSHKDFMLIISISNLKVGTLLFGRYLLKAKLLGCFDSVKRLVFA
jgi:hypothetical protein